LEVSVSIDDGEAGITVYSCENEHYEVAVRKEGEEYEALLRLNIGGIKQVQKVKKLPAHRACLSVNCDGGSYSFSVKPITEKGTSAEAFYLGSGQTKYVSKEVSEGFTGVILAMYAVGQNTAEFTEFGVTYKDSEE